MEDITQVGGWFFKIEYSFNGVTCITARRMDVWGEPYNSISFIKVEDGLATVEPILALTPITTTDFNTFRRYLYSYLNCHRMTFSRWRKGNNKLVKIELSAERDNIDK